MGVPSFYRWLVGKYPKIVVNAVEEETDSSLPNPNAGFLHEFHNFYVDMNGVIHHCFHPEDALSPPTTNEEVFEAIFDYLDRLFNIVRPRKLLYLAIDGVAPRAKMNQQRSRRFRTAKDKQIMEEEEMKLRKRFASEGKEVLEKEESQVSDSNVITPGTAFMYTLSLKLQTYIQNRIKSNKGWKDIKVILSDSNTPGEGEHKINSFIRAQRTFPDYDPNTRHCLYGLDADLIMLALASHELHFSVLRENVLIQDDISSSLSSLQLSLHKAESHTVSSRGWFRKHDDGVVTCDKVKHFREAKNKFQFLNVWVLREYLDLEICTDLIEDAKFHSNNNNNAGASFPEASESQLHNEKRVERPNGSKADLERVIDDFVFMCFFAGNDFLPHMPTLDIHEGAIDLLIYVYKKEFKNLGGYLVDIERVDAPKGGCIKLSRVEKFILSVSAFEEKIFMKRMKIREKRNRRIVFASEDDDLQDEEGNNDLVLDSKKDVDISALDILENTKELKQKLKDSLRHNADTFKHGVVADKVKLGLPGWRERYYMQKFKLQSQADVERTRRDVVTHYTKGLLWVLLYYFKGVPSWGWYYPYHYGPFASDMKGMAQTSVKFKMEEPFKPFDQLMSVLPPGSAHALPNAYQRLMQDDKSRIIDFYPTNFETDMDGKRFLWQVAFCSQFCTIKSSFFFLNYQCSQNCQCLFLFHNWKSRLPFIEEGRLMVETKIINHSLTEDERKRNAETKEQLFMDRSCELAVYILSCFKEGSGSGLHECNPIKVDGAALSGGGVCGMVWQNKDHINDASGNTLCVFFHTSPISPFIPRVLAGTDYPKKIVSEVDFDKTVVLWHEEFHGRTTASCYSNSRPLPPANYQSSKDMPNVEPRDHHWNSNNNNDGARKGAGGSGWNSSRKTWCRPELQKHNRYTPLPQPRCAQPPTPMPVSSPRIQWQRHQPPTVAESSYQGGPRYNNNVISSPWQGCGVNGSSPPMSVPAPANPWQRHQPPTVPTSYQGGARYNSNVINSQWQGCRVNDSSPNTMSASAPRNQWQQHRPPTDALPSYQGRARYNNNVSSSQWRGCGVNDSSPADSGRWRGK
ncbi:unnamed protein product [Cuscuta epithymum]|uniref:5'-3' exoribonuclease n=1 Tax=Cuscuta epithymum TaxID=186058 RepID=A0AAV0DUF8_9ASTE|nr:unnamed protein product [Cuscuta epithymum]